MPKLKSLRLLLSAFVGSAFTLRATADKKLGDFGGNCNHGLTRINPDEIVNNTSHGADLTPENCTIAD